MLNSGYIPFSILLEVWCQVHADLDTETELVCYSFVCRRTRQDPNAGNIASPSREEAENEVEERHSVAQTWNWVIGSPGQWVIWVIFYARVTGSLFWPGVIPEFFRFSKKIKNTQNAKRTLEMLKWSHYQVSVVGMKSLDVSPSNELLLLEFIIEQGHRVNWVSGSLDSRVAGSQNVTQFHVWYCSCFRSIRYTAENRHN